GLITSDPVEEKQPLGTKILMFERAFHGRSGYTLSMTHTIDPRKYKYYPKFHWFRVEPPILFFDNNGNISNHEEVSKQQQQAIDEIKSILRQHADDIAAFVIEPIQCEGGDRHLPEGFFTELRSLTEENDILLIYDEVQTGCGTTGKIWGHQHFGADARPDLIAFSKKTQVGGVMANYDKMNIVKENSFNNETESKSRLNSTWGGNPVDMMRCKVLCEIIEQENLQQNVKETGQYLLNNIRELCREFNQIIENPRGRGFLFAFDAKTPDLKGKIWQAFYDQNFLGLTCGSKTLRFRPHLDLTREEADEAIKRIRAGLSTVK
ncbi:aminotransferase class III-fold pyridoxal phosphate-dependent enzyme, partial [candidate division KSB1 bacterium]|nr:aminotransferase class III-fold pyridoxal phosphate-dependent enzyme [candidate division KSB1 bacterium]